MASDATPPGPERRGAYRVDTTARVVRSLRVSGRPATSGSDATGSRSKWAHQSRQQAAPDQNTHNDPREPVVGTHGTKDSIREVLRNGPFLRLWMAQAISQTANNMVNFALLLRVRGVVEFHSLPQANTAISLVILAFSLPSVLFGPIAGVMADRANRRTVMAIVNVLRALSMLGFLIIQTHWQVNSILAAHYIGTFVFGMAGQFFAPAQGASIPALVPKRQLISANALFNLTGTGAQLIGFAALGPVLVQIIGVEAVFALMIPVFLVCAGLVWTLPKDALNPRALAVPGARLHPMRQLWADIREGLVYIAKDGLLVRAIAYLTIAATTFLMVAALGPGFITEVVGLPKEDIGYVVAPAGIGVLVGVLTVSRVSGRVERAPLIDWALVGAGIFLGLGALSHEILDAIVGTVPEMAQVTFTGVLLFAAGVCNAFVLVPAQTLLQERSHESMQARVYATFFTISNTVSFVPIFFAAAFADVFGVVEVLVVVATMLVAVGFASIISRRYHARGMGNGQSDRLVE